MKILKQILKQILPKSWHMPVRVAVKSLCTDKRILNYLNGTKGKKKFLIIGVPEHTNIGDHAIAYAEKKFLMDHFPETDIVEIPTLSFFSTYRKLSKFKDDCIVLVIGGGSLGTLYWDFEYLLQLVIKTFSQQQIVVFPQTVYWAPGDYFTKRIEKYIKLYEKHPALTVFIRDKSVTFMENTMNRNKKFKVLNVPDIVLYLNKTEKKLNRKNFLFCLRSDKEKVINTADSSRLITYVKGKFNAVTFIDMLYVTDIPIQCREWILENKFNEFRSAQLVITDRLHGMILSVITGTPCIALNNSSEKVKGVYELWLKQLPYIKFANNIDEAIELIDNLSLETSYDYDPSIFVHHWNEIAKIVESEVKK